MRPWSHSLPVTRSAERASDAVLIKSTIFSNMSGSLAGSTAARNRGGLYLRNRSTPLNPQTAKQLAIRNAVSSLVSAWKNTLTAAQRAAWATYADQTPVINRLGDSRNLTGINWYTACNVPRIQAGLARVDDGPTTPGLATFTTPTLQQDGAGAKLCTLTFTSGDSWVSEDGAAMLVWDSQSLPASINFFNGRFNFANAILGNATTPPPSPASFLTAFDPISGDAMFFRVRVTLADGRLSSLQTIRVVVT